MLENGVDLHGVKFWFLYDSMLRQFLAFTEVNLFKNKLLSVLMIKKNNLEEEFFWAFCKWVVCKLNRSVCFTENIFENYGATRESLNIVKIV